MAMPPVFIPPVNRRNGDDEGVPPMTPGATFALAMLALAVVFSWAMAILVLASAVAWVTG